MKYSSQVYRVIKFIAVNFLWIVYVNHSNNLCSTMNSIFFTEEKPLWFYLTEHDSVRLFFNNRLNFSLQVKRYGVFVM